MYATADRPSRLNQYSDDEGLNSDEEEEERHLSEQHGEAGDDTATKRKCTNTTTLTEDDAASKEFEGKVPSKKPQKVPRGYCSFVGRFRPQ